MRELTVDLGDRSYPIYIGTGLLDQIGDYCLRHDVTTSSPMMIVTDETIAPLYLDQVTARLEAAGYKVVPAVVAAGERSKTLQVLQDVTTIALDEGLDRQSTIMALGGGVVGDLAGFVAASFMRGVRFIQVPTTILAHDSSVGGKVAVNHPQAKNIIGAFYQPAMVLYDIATLHTLPKREVKGGLAEVLKHGLIWDEAFVKWVDEHADRLLALESEAMQHALYQGCLIKSIVVSQDEKEHGLRALLNLGHTIGHALEAVCNYEELIHGEAISIGMIGAALLSEKLGYDASIYHETKRLLQKLGLPTNMPKHIDIDQVMAAMMHDKKFKAGHLNFVVATKIGQAELARDIPEQWIRDILTQLKQ